MDGSTVPFSKLELAAMPEKSDCDSIDQVSLFLGAIPDTFCGDFENGKVTKVFTDYADLVRLKH